MRYFCAHCGCKLIEPVAVPVAYCSPGCREAAEDAILTGSSNKSRLRDLPNHEGYEYTGLLQAS